MSKRGGVEHVDQYLTREEAERIKGQSGYDRMVEHSEHPTYLHSQHPDGWADVVCYSKTPPTREDLIEGWMTVGVKTPTHRDDAGYWQYEERKLTREEAEAKVDAFLRANEVKSITKPAA